jgi:hypothetical protein
MGSSRPRIPRSRLRAEQLADLGLGRLGLIAGFDEDGELLIPAGE